MEISFYPKQSSRRVATSPRDVSRYIGDLSVNIYWGPSMDD